MNTEFPLASGKRCTRKGHILTVANVECSLVIAVSAKVQSDMQGEGIPGALQIFWTTTMLTGAGVVVQVIWKAPRW